MPGRILIVDSVATNRTVLKVKMHAAQFTVDACANRADAEAAILKNPPDLILLNLSDPTEDRHSFCRALRSAAETAAIAIIAVSVTDTSKARFAALDAGADDVLPRPINDALLLARIRSLLRARSTTQEMVLRDSTSRTLGFEEIATEFEAAAHVSVLTSVPETQSHVLAILRAGLRHNVRSLDPAAVLRESASSPTPDLFVIDATDTSIDHSTLFGLVSDLRSRAQTRLATQMIIAPKDVPEIAAMFLDLGADDVVPAGTCAGEVTLRAKALIRRKQQQDRLRDTVRNGLHAAVTDPLTGLYNRRYVESHLARLAQQSCNSGRALAVMMIDIDHFKTINDTYGHAAGDMVLVALAKRLRENLRAIDLVARMGGEEFLVAMPRTSAKQARLAADRLRRLIKNTLFATGPDDAQVQITVSVGVAVSAKTGPKKRSLVQICDHADAALYAAKSAGRNKVAMSGSTA